jgi:LAO/AO transport system kinase
MDPVSPFSGGSFLADRIRMGEQKQEVYFRSLSSAAVPGGLTSGLARALRVLAAAGYQQVLIETVGSGQDEIKVHTLADTVLVVEAPGLGDDIQALKMGILEIADVYVVNKKDQPGAETLAGYLSAMLETPGAGCRICRVTQSENCGWSSPVLLASAEKGEGVDHLLRRIKEHRSRHRAKRGAFDEFRKLSEAVEEVDAAYLSARRAAVETGNPGGRSVPRAGKAIMEDVLRRLQERAEEETKR